MIDKIKHKATVKYCQFIIYEETANDKAWSTKYPTQGGRAFVTCHGLAEKTGN